jgi:quinol---cytochrome c reductase iron-sulfur subunit, bacillus type
MDPHGEHPHLPGPSVYPVGFAIGVACLLVGIVISWLVAAVGAGIAIVFAFLWIREVAGKRGLTEVAETAPEARTPLEEPGPKPEPGERFPRSVFLEGATLGIGALIGGIVTVPALGFMVLPSFVDQGYPDVDLGPLENFPENEFVVATFLQNPEEGEVSRRTAFVRYNGLLDNQPSFTILSSRCVHLGCPTQPGGLIQDAQAKEHRSGGNVVRLIPVVGTSGFGCPCHGGAYDNEGNRTAGPPVRSMDRFAYSIKDSRLLLGRAFSVAHVENSGKDAKIRKYKLATPGEHIDGIERWMYPIQPPR